MFRVLLTFDTDGGPTISAAPDLSKNLSAFRTGLAGGAGIDQENALYDEINNRLHGSVIMEETQAAQQRASAFQARPPMPPMPSMPPAGPSVPAGMAEAMFGGSPFGGSMLGSMFGGPSGGSSGGSAGGSSGGSRGGSAGGSAGGSRGGSVGGSTGGSAGGSRGGSVGVQTPEPPPAPVKPSCSSCGATWKVHICRGCNAAWYCGQDCQRQDWRRHKEECKRVGAAKKG